MHGGLLELVRKLFELYPLEVERWGGVVEGAVTVVLLFCMGFRLTLVFYGVLWYVTPRALTSFIGSYLF